jgi:hypothetical protein
MPATKSRISNLRKTILESSDSASPIVTRSVASVLRGEPFNTYSFPAWQRAALFTLSAFPGWFIREILSRSQSFFAIDPSDLVGLSIETLALTRLEDYSRIDEQFQCITVGAALGGAAAHLALALGGPFLPIAFVLTLRGGTPSGNIEKYFQRSQALAERISRQNPGVLTVQHFDPIHDGWLTKWINHLRLKLLALPEAYKNFIRDNLKPGGEICYLDCSATWLRYRISDRNIFQVGGWGDISPQEFLEASPRLQAYCKHAGLEQCGWQLPGYPLERGPESEWGCEPQFRESLQEFCAIEGYRFVPVPLPGPHDYSKLAYYAVQHLLGVEGREPAGVLVEMFSQFDPVAVMRAGLLPLWLVFNTLDSLEFLQRMRTEFNPQKPVFFSPLSTFSLTPDLVSWKTWENALESFEWINIGSRPNKYPSDPLALVDWNKKLRRWVEQHENPIQSRMTAEDLRYLALDKL